MSWCWHNESIVAEWTAEESLEVLGIMCCIEDPGERKVLMERQMQVREWIKHNYEHWKKMKKDERHIVVCSSTIRQDGSLKGRSCCSPVDLKGKLDYFISQVVCPSTFKYPFPIKRFVSAAMSFVFAISAFLFISFCCDTSCGTFRVML